MDRDRRRALEAILFVVDEPVDVSTLAQVLELGRVEVVEALEQLRRQLEDEDRGFVLREIAGGWRLYTAPDAAPYVERWVLDGRSGRLSQAALESLAVVAYKQPVSRHQVSEIRGVNADGALRTLVRRGLVQEVGRDAGPGQAILYGTTVTFLEKLGLSSLDDLPALTEFLAEGVAPDEPRPDDLAVARERLRSGEELPATGRASWDPLGSTTDLDVLDDELPESGSRGRTEMDDLTADLDRAARNAMASLEEALRAVEERDETDPEDEDGTSA